MASLRTQFQDALGRYWDCAYAEGKEGREFDTPDGRAQETLSELLQLFDVAERSLVDRPSSPNALEDQSQALRQSDAAASAMTALPVVSIVSVHEPKITTHYGFSGSGQVRLDDFTFVEVNYDYRYTHNSHRHFVTETIASWLRGELKFVPADAAVPQQHSEPHESKESGGAGQVNKQRGELS